MHKSHVKLIMVNNKGKILFEQEGRRSKVIRNFIKKSIENVWVLKWDVFEVIKNTIQFTNIWGYFEAISRAEKEKKENGNSDTE